MHAGIIAHMEGAYRDIAARKGTCFPPLDHLHSGRAVETPPQRDGRAPVGPQGWVNFLDDIGIDGQEKLLAAHALVIGAGGLGSPVALYLASAGIGKIRSSP